MPCPIQKIQLNLVRHGLRRSIANNEHAGSKLEGILDLVLNHTRALQTVLQKPSLLQEGFMHGNYDCGMLFKRSTRGLVMQ